VAGQAPTRFACSPGVSSLWMLMRDDGDSAETLVFAAAPAGLLAVMLAVSSARLPF